MNHWTRFFTFAAVALIIGGAALAQDKPVADDPKPVAPALVAPVEGKLTLLPSAFTSFGAAAQDGYLYFIGGHTAPAHHYYREGFQTGFWRLSLADRNSFEQLPGGVSLQSVALVSDGKRVIRVGGMTARNAEKDKDDLHSTAEVAAFDPLARAWSNLPALPVVRSSHDAVVHGGKLYVFGGWQLAGGGDDTPWHEAGAALDLAAKEPAWASVTQPFKKRALALASVGTQIYAIGGMTPDGMSKSVDLYDSVKNEWSKGPDLPGFAFGTSAYGMNGRAYATTYEGGLFSHAPGEKEWKRDGTLTFPRIFHRMVATGSELAIVAGTMRGGHLRNIEWIKPGVTEPSLTRMSIPAPGTAKVRQGVFAHQGSLYVFGGNNSTQQHQFKPENFVDEAFRIRLTDFSATRIANLPMRRQSFATFMTGTGPNEEPAGFALGGFGHDGKAAVSQAGILKYDFVGDKWEQLPSSLPSPMTQFGHAVYKDKVYLFGGMDFDPARGEKGQFKLSSRIWVWDRLSDDEGARKEFRALEVKLGTGRRAFAGAEMGGKYYVTGGMTDRFEEVENCEVFDFATGKCEDFPAPQDPRISGKLIPLGGKLYLVGGSVQTEKGLETCRRIDVYDPATKAWSVAVSDIGFEPGELQAGVFGQSLLIYSAHNDNGVLNLLFVKP